MKPRTWPVLGVTLAVLWLFVRGVPLDPRVVAGELLLGLAFGLPVAYTFRRLYADRTDVGRALRAAPYAALYLAAFLRELVTANVDVAYRVLAPSRPIEPAVVVLPLRVETDLAITTIANSITLTPGTLTMDYDADANALYVHTIDGRDRDSVVAPIRTWEDYALVIFDEPKKPGDPVPDLPPEMRADGRPGDAPDGDGPGADGEGDDPAGDGAPGDADATGDSPADDGPAGNHTDGGDADGD